MTGFRLVLLLGVILAVNADVREPRFDCSKVENTYLYSPAQGTNRLIELEDDHNCYRKRRIWECLKPLMENYDPDHDAVDFDAFAEKYAECTLWEYYKRKPTWVELIGNRSELRNEGLERMRIEIKVGPMTFDTGDVPDNSVSDPETMLIKWVDNGDSQSYFKSQLIENVIRITSETTTTTRSFKWSHSYGVKPDEVKDEDKKKFIEKNKGKKLSIRKGWQTAKRKFREKMRESMDILTGKKKPEEEEEEEKKGMSGSAEQEKYHATSDTTSTTTTTARMHTFEDTLVVPPKKSVKVVWTSFSRELDLGWQTEVFVSGWIAFKANINAGRDIWFLPVGDMASYYNEFFERQNSYSMSFIARGVHRSTQAKESHVDILEFPLRTPGSCPKAGSKNNAAMYLEDMTH